MSHCATQSAPADREKSASRKADLQEEPAEAPALPESRNGGYGNQTWRLRR